MDRQTIYIESTVISYFTARRSRDIVAAAHQQITRDWWKGALTKLDPYISQVVIDEISRGDEDAVRRRMEAVSGFKVLTVTEELPRLAAQYYQALTVPEKARNDTYHLALATLHGMDFLVSWNCSHIAAARVRRTIEHINDELGYETPVICTPEELMEVSG